MNISLEKSSPEAFSFPRRDAVTKKQSTPGSEAYLNVHMCAYWEKKKETKGLER